MGASEGFLVEIELCHREKENAECYDDTGGRKGRRYLGMNHPRHRQEYHIQ
jgi:hypothetical protein